MAGGGGLLVGSQGESQVAHGMLEETSKALKHLATADFKGLAVQVAQMPGLIQEWGEQLIESKRGLAQFSAEMAMVFAEADIREIQRGMKIGEATGASTGGLSDASQDLKDSLAPFQTAFSNASNMAMEGLTRGLNLLVQVASKVTFIEDINEILEWFADWARDKDEEDKLDFGKQLKDLEKPHDEYNRRRVPRR